MVIVLLLLEAEQWHTSRRVPDRSGAIECPVNTLIL